MNDNKEGMEIEEKDQDMIFEEDEKYVTSLFDQDGIETPESLSTENIEKKLEAADAAAAPVVAAETAEAAKAEPIKVTVRKRTWKKQFTAVLAACACLLLVLVPALNAGKADPLEGDAVSDAGLTTFTSYKQIRKVLDDMTEAGSRLLYKNGTAAEGDVVMEDSAVSGSAPKAATAPGSAETGHSDTYLQVKGVDEADLVKCDDEYLYYISNLYDRIYICRADQGKSKRVSSIKAPKEKEFTAMFLNGDRLVTVAGGFWGSVETEVAVYDITDRSKPKKTASYVQSGSPVSQRMADGVVYLVTDKYADVRDIPYCGAVKETKKLRPEDICCVPNPVSPEYTVIGAVDVSSGEELSHVTKAVLGGSQDIYSNGENLYVAGLTYIKNKEDKKTADDDKTEDNEMIDRIYPYYRGIPATVIIKVKMAKGDISLEKTAVVKGTIDDQFSMDEKDGEFRIATTSLSEEGQDINNLFVLDKKLKLLGKVSGFAKGESIKAVRYIKDKAYVITYEQTDPLFVIDLSNSRKPKIEGEVKIDGFSTLLVPLSEDRLLGIGYDVQEVETWQETAGLKFVIFDISDPSKPKVVTSKALDGVFSNVQDDHRGLVVLGEGEKARFVLPCWEEFEEYAEDDDAEVYDDAEDNDDDNTDGDDAEDTDIDDEETTDPVEPEEDIDDSGDDAEELNTIDDEYRGGALEITAKDGKISILDYHRTRDSVSRCPVIKDYIYAICDNDEIESFRLK